MPIPSSERIHGRRRRGHAARLGISRPPTLERLEDRTLLNADALANAVLLPFTAAQNAHVASRLATPNQVDLYRLPDVAAGDVVSAAVSAQTSGSALQSLLRVFDATGRPIALDDQEGGDPRLTFQAPATGDYYIGISSAGDDAYDPTTTVTGQGGVTTGMYTLDLRSTPAPLQANLTGSSFRLNAQTAAWGETVSGTFTIENRGGADAGPFDVELVLSANNRFDPSSPNSWTVAQLTGLAAGTASSGSLTVTLPAQPDGFPTSGPVYLGLVIDPAQAVPELNPFAQSAVHRGSDWEALTIVTPVTANASNHSQAKAQTLDDPNSRVNGQLAAGQVDWYKLTLADTGRLTANLAAAPGSTLVPRLTLTDPGGGVLTQSDEGALVQYLQPGTYYLTLSARSGAGKYQLLSQTISASPPSAPLSVGPDPSSVVVADLNGDGIPDLVATSRFSGAVSVMLGVGDGSFLPPQTLSDGLGASAVAVADLNGDGIPDLVVTNSNLFSEALGDTVSVFPGNGDGTFGPPQTFAVGNGPSSVAVADLNGDGNPDLVVANQVSNTLSVLVGNGNGTFLPQETFAVGTDPSAVAVADLNGDGKPDLIVANSGDNTVSVLMGSGDGTFLPQQTFAVGTVPSAVAVADLNGDGKPDLIVANSGDNTVSVLMGNGDGTFLSQQTFAVGTDPSALAVADLNGDGKPDLVVANQVGNTLSVLRGNGDGTFRPMQTVTVGAGPTAVAAADLNGDGNVDLITTNDLDSTATVLLGSGDGSFRSQDVVGVGASPDAVAPSDLNRDGKPDLVVANFADNTVSVLLGNGDGTFMPQQTFATGSGPRAVAVADLNNDGRPDLVVANANDNTVSVLLGIGTGSFVQQTTFAVGADPVAVAVADLNDDGIPDLVVANKGDGTVSVLLGKGDGSFLPQETFAVGADPDSVVVADFNGDGKPDLAVADYGSNSVSVLLGNGDGTFRPQQTDAVGSGPVSLAAADLNGDGKPDLVVANANNVVPSSVYPFLGSGVSVLLGNGDGTFQPQQSLFDVFAASSIAVTDLNGDGIPDLAIADGKDSSDVTVLLGNGGGSFQAPLTFPVGGGPVSIAAVDVNGDGNPDLVTANQGNDTVSVLLGSGADLFQPAQTLTVGRDPTSAVVASFNISNTELLVADAANNTVGVLQANPDGTFQATRSYAVGADPTSVALVSSISTNFLTPTPELVVTNGGDGTVSVLQSNTDGTFQPAHTYAVGADPTSVAQMYSSISPFPALVVTNAGDNTVSVLQGNFDGTFQPAQTYAVGKHPTSVAATYSYSTNGPAEELVVTNGGDGTVSVLLGNPDGTFQPAQTYAVGKDPTSVAVAYNYSTIADTEELVVTNGGDGTVSVLLGNPDGTFQPAKTYAVGADPTSVTVAYNYSTIADTEELVVTNGGDGTVSVLLGNPDGTFQPAQTYAVGADPTSVTVTYAYLPSGAFVQELIVANAGDNTVSVLLGNADGTFQPAKTFAAGPRPTSVAVTTFSSAFTELVLANTADNTVSVLKGNASGAFQPAQTYPVGKQPTSVAVVSSYSTNSGLIPELVVTNAGDNTVSVLQGDADGTFQPAQTYAVGKHPTSVAVASTFSTNGPAQELVVTNGGDGTVSVLQGDADGTFQPAQTYAVGKDPTSVAVANVNGGTDLIVTNGGDGTVSVLQANPDGTFQLAQTCKVGADPTSVAVTYTFSNTFTSTPELIVTNGGDGTVSVLQLDADGTFQPAQTYTVGRDPTSVAVADLNGDGIPDVVVTNAGDNTVSVLLGDSNGDGSFLPALTSAAGADPTSVAALSTSSSNLPPYNFSPLIPELLVTNGGGGTVSVLLPTSRSPFSPTTAATGVGLRNTPYQADLDGDHTLDRVILDSVSPQLPGSILFRKGLPGTTDQFAAPITLNDKAHLGADRPARDLTVLNLGTGSGIATADASADPTLSSPGNPIYTVSLYTLDASDNVTRRTVIATPKLPTRIAAGDLTRAGLDDLVVANGLDNSVTVAFQTAPGVFGPAVTYPVGFAPSDIALVDVDGNGLLDIVVTDQASGDVAVLLNEGNQSFAPVERFRASTDQYSLDSSNNETSLAESVGLAAGDFTGDGRNDLVVLNRGSDSFTVLPNDGDGGFGDPQAALTTVIGGATQGEQLGPMVAARFRGPEQPLDLAIVRQDLDQVWIYQNDGAGHFVLASTVTVGPGVTGLTVVPGSTPGVLDLLVGNEYGDILRLVGNGDDTFQPLSSVTGARVSLAVQDAGDGPPTALVADQQKNQVSIQALSANGSGFTAVGALNADNQATQLAPGAVQWAKLEGPNGPTYAVVVASGSNDVLVYRVTGADAAGNPTFAASQTYFVGTDPVSVTIQDINGDGVPDMLIADQGSNDIAVLYGSLDAIGHWVGTPGPRLTSGGAGPIAVAVRDVNGDGIADLVVTNGQSGTLTVLPGRGQGFFDDRNPEVLQIPGAPTLVQGPTAISASGFGVVVTATGQLISFNVDNFSATVATAFTPPAGQNVVAVQTLADGQLVAVEEGGTVALLAAEAGSPTFQVVQVLQELNPLVDGIPSNPSALAVLESASGLRVLVTNEGQDQIFEYAVQGPGLSGGPGTGTVPEGTGQPLPVFALTVTLGPPTVTLTESEGVPTELAATPFEPPLTFVPEPSISLPTAVAAGPISETTTPSGAPLLLVVTLSAGLLPAGEANTAVLEGANAVGALDASLGERVWLTASGLSPGTASLLARVLAETGVATVIGRPDEDPNVPEGEARDDSDGPRVSDFGLGIEDMLWQLDQRPARGERSPDDESSLETPREPPPGRAVALAAFWEAEDDDEGLEGCGVRWPELDRSPPRLPARTVVASGSLAHPAGHTSEPLVATGPARAVAVPGDGSALAGARRTPLVPDGECLGEVEHPAAPAQLPDSAAPCPCRREAWEKALLAILATHGLTLWAERRTEKGREKGTQAMS